MNGMPARDEMLEMVALYALGVLPREEAALVAAFLANDVEARAEYLSLRAGADAIAMTADEPVDSGRSARMKERLMARVRTSDSTVARRRIGPNAGWLWAAGLATAASLIVATVAGIQDFARQGQVAQSNSRASALATQLAERTKATRRDQDMIADLASPDARRYPVTGGSVIVRGERVYFALEKLPVLPRGKVYQAWTLARGAKTVQPSLTFTPGVRIVALPVDATKVGAVAVSVEPDGGSKAPTSTPIFVRPLS